MNRIPGIRLDMLEFEENGAFSEGDDEGTRLLATLQIGNTLFHVEAIEVFYPEETREQTPHPAWQESFELYYQACGAEGAFSTTIINGREYALFITPYCT